MADMPRTFRLYEELEKAEHAQLSDQSVSYGLDEGDDKTFTNWNGTIIGPPNTTFDMRIMSIKIVCGEKYPVEAPEMKFVSKVNLPFVNKDNGTVTKSFTLFNPWKPEYTMEKLLIGIKDGMMKNKTLAQPPDGQ
jgi:ubiquitin-conjugating enzyme E2 variant